MKNILLRTLLLYSWFLHPQELLPLIKELIQLDQKLTAVENILKSSSPKKLSYRELEAKIKEAYVTKNPTLLNSLEQTVAVTTAQHLITEILQEGLAIDENVQADEYIPFAAHVAQKTSERYPNKQETINCVALASGWLDKEFLIVRALRYVGYKKIRLVPIDTMYFSINKKFTLGEEYRNNFVTWCTKRNIPTSIAKVVKPAGKPVTIEKPALIEDGVMIELFADSYLYIEEVIKNELAKNHLLIMIQPGGGNNPEKEEFAIRSSITSSQITPNSIVFFNLNKNNTLDIFFPYDKNDSFILTKKKKDSPDIDKNQINTIENYIRNWNQPQHLPFYQKSIMNDIVSKFYKKEPLELFIFGMVAANPWLSFIDLIKHTANEPQNPLAFAVMFLNLTEFTDMSGSMKDVYMRYL